jgi:DNA-binding NarL/FixJ family response regulator
MRRARLLLAERQPIFRVGLRAFLERESDFEVVETGALEGVYAISGDRAADIAIVDLELPPEGGIPAVTALAEAGIAALVWGFSPQPAQILAAVRAGAVGSLDKCIAPAGLLRALRGVARGEAPLSREVTALVVAELRDAEKRTQAEVRASRLSERETEVLELIAEGAPTREVASLLLISEFTVKRHVQNILAKLDLPSRAAAAAFYRSWRGGGVTAGARSAG